MLYDVIIFFISNLKFLSSLYLLSASVLKLCCFIADQPILGPTTFCGLFAVAAAIACIATLVTCATAFAIATLVIACLFAIFFYISLMSA